MFDLPKRSQPVRRYTKTTPLSMETLESRALMAGLVSTVPASHPLDTQPALVAAPTHGPWTSPTQQQNLAKLRSDLASIHAGSQVTPGQIEQLKTDIVILVQGTTRPSQESVTQLRTDLQTSLSDGKLTKSEQRLLEQDIATVLASAHIPISEIKAVVADVQSILESSGINQATIATLRTDVQAIVTEFRNQHPGG